MEKIKMYTGSLPNIPWEDRPLGCDNVVWRYSGNPVIKRNPVKGAARIFNSAVCPYGDGFVGVFRADHTNTMPGLHVGYSKNGIDWEFEEKTISWIGVEDGKEYNCSYSYDPRLVKIDDWYYIMWCANFSGPTIGLGKTQDFKTFYRYDNAFLPFNRNGVLFPRKIGGNYVMLSRPSDNGHTPFGDIFISESPDLTYWGKHKKVMSVSGDWWQATKIGGGAIPIETNKGWLLFYHGVTNTCNGFVYSFGASLLDKDEPSKVLLRTKNYLLTPELEYEVNGFVPNVAFPCCCLADEDTGRIAIYYGAADTYTAVAFTQLDELYEHMQNDNALQYGDDIIIK